MEDRYLVEFAKCRQDPVYFMETYCRVAHPTKGLVPFKLYDFQKRVVRDFLNNRFVIVNKSRQVGLSTVTSNYALWLALFFKNRTIKIISIKDNDAKDFLKKIKTSYNGLPQWLRDEPVVSNVHTLELTSGSIIESVPSGSSAARGTSPSLLIIDEFAFIPRIEDIWTSAYPALCLSPDTLVLTMHGIKKIGDMIKTKSRWTFVDPHEEQYVHDGKSFNRVIKHFVTSKVPVLRITTKLGTVLEVTPEHKLLTQDGWKRASELVSGRDYLKRVLGTEVYGPKHFDPDEAYRLGGYIAEGWMNYQAPRSYKMTVSNTDGEFREVFLRDGWRPIRGDIYKLLVTRKEYVERYIEYGVDPDWKCYTKEVPTAILEADKESQGHFLAGLIDGDGYIGRRAIILASTSHKLLQQVQFMLFNMGIWANIIEGQSPEQRLTRDLLKSRKLPSGNLPNSYRRIWYLKIPGSYFKKVLQIIPLRIRRKREALLNCEVRYDWGSKMAKAPVTEYLRSAMETYTPHQWRYDYNIRIDKPLKNGQITVKKAIEICSVLGREPDWLIEPNVHWDLVVDIQQVGKREMYDFTVEPTHQFLQNGIVGSNSQGGSAILISTPNGIASLFYQLWSKADPSLPEEERNNFHRIFVHWTEVPEYRGFEIEPGMTQEEIIRKAREGQWYKMMRPQFTDRRWAQEFEGDFLGSGNTVIKGERLKELVHKTKEPQIKYRLLQRDENDYELVVDDEGPLWVWEQPREDKIYLLSADVASGVSEDYSAFYVFDIASGRIVAEFKGKLNTIKYAHLLNKVGSWYNNATIVPEVTGLGYGTLQKLMFELGYTNVFRRVDPRKPKQNKKDQWGWQTTPKTKPFLINAIIEYFDNDVEYISERLWEELAAFVWKTSDDAGAEQGHNDDLVMALAIGLYAMKLYKMRSPLPEAMLYSESERAVTDIPAPLFSTRVDDMAAEIQEWLYGAWKQDK